MAKWMGACDCIITKVRTIAKALIRGLPIILNHYIPRQEKGNVPYVVENGVSVFTRSSNETARIVAEWFSTKSDDLKRMSENALKLAQPEAVFDIVVKVLKGMGEPGCIPDFNSYGIVIGALYKVRKTVEEEDMMKQMVVKHGLTPGQGTLVKLFMTLRVNREIWKAVELIEFLEKEGHSVGFESYELVVEGCVEKREYVLAGKGNVVACTKTPPEVRQQIIDAEVKKKADKDAIFVESNGHFDDDEEEVQEIYDMMAGGKTAKRVKSVKGPMDLHYRKAAKQSRQAGEEFGDEVQVEEGDEMLRENIYGYKRKQPRQRGASSSGSKRKATQQVQEETSDGDENVTETVYNLSSEGESAAHDEEYLGESDDY
ncbi:hypothetical protein RIF29_15873 [Crotalaria pallida]|uniref:Uncharacterized protein n=1 Tax=Crotalaria pallida TaxID=3830 RepID=A0AAN9FFN8_CROPI